MNPGDIVFYEDRKYGIHRFYLVEACHYGGLGCESVVELRSLTERPGVAYGQDLPPTTMVPEPLLRDIPVYRPYSRFARNKP